MMSISAPPIPRSGCMKATRNGCFYFDMDIFFPGGIFPKKKHDLEKCTANALDLAGIG